MHNCGENGSLSLGATDPECTDNCADYSMTRCMVLFTAAINAFRALAIICTICLFDYLALNRILFTKLTVQ